MNTVTTTSAEHQAKEPVSFDNTEVAFSSKTNADLRRAYWLFRIIGNQGLSLAGKQLTKIALALRLPIKGMVKATIFKQFCGGETIADCAETTKVLDAYHIGTILDYSVEGKEADEEFERTRQETIRTINTAHGNPHIPFCVFKVTGLCRNALLEKLSNGTPLDEIETMRHQRLKDRVNSICRQAYETGTPVFIDAEESWTQPAIDLLATEMMEKYNRESAVVYNTLQMYRHDRLAHLQAAHAAAKAGGYFYGVKLVRGAYMEKERDRAAAMGYPSPIQADKATTDRDFNAAIDYCLANIESIAFCAGSHNEQSSMHLAREMDRLGIAHSDKRVYFAQLFGMSDHISFNLSKAGYNVAKYVPYGPVKDVMPYLIRRAEENTSVAGQTGRELRLIIKELKRRKQGGAVR
jgi:proline dehydrogenase